MRKKMVSLRATIETQAEIETSSSDEDICVYMEAMFMQSEIIKTMEKVHVYIVDDPEVKVIKQENEDE